MPMSNLHLCRSLPARAIAWVTSTLSFVAYHSRPWLILIPLVCSRVYLAQARVFLAKTAWNFDLFRDDDGGRWLDQKAFLVFEPKELRVRLTEASHSVL